MPDRDFAPSGFFVSRTPLLPFEEIEAWSASLTGDWVADRELLRSRLRAIVERPEVLEALFLASPSLVDGLAAWRLDPEGKKGQRAERALVRYFLRMASRATPFGLFSGCSLGEVRPAPEAATRLAIGPRAASRRRTRLDMDYLFALCEDLRRDGKLRAELAYRPNSSLYRAAGRLRYAEARLAGKVRSHHLVAVESSPYVEAALACAGASPTGASAAETTAAVAAADPDGEVSAAGGRLRSPERRLGPACGRRRALGRPRRRATGGRSRHPGRARRRRDRRTARPLLPPRRAARGPAPPRRALPPLPGRPHQARARRGARRRGAGGDLPRGGTAAAADGPPGQGHLRTLPEGLRGALRGGAREPAAAGSRRGDRHRLRALRGCRRRGLAAAQGAAPGSGRARGGAQGELGSAPGCPARPPRRGPGGGRRGDRSFG